MVVVPRAVLVKVVDQPAVVVVKGMAVDGQVERAMHRVEGGAMHLQAAAVSKFLVSFS